MHQMRAKALSLTLFVFRVFLVDHVNAALATNNFVFGAAFFDTGTNFHVNKCLIACLNTLYARKMRFGPFLVIADLLRHEPYEVHDIIVKLTCSGRLSVL